MKKKWRKLQQKQRETKVGALQRERERRRRRKKNQKERRMKERKLHVILFQSSVIVGICLDSFVERMVIISTGFLPFFTPPIFSLSSLFLSLFSLSFLGVKNEGKPERGK